MMCKDCEATLPKTEWILEEVYEERYNQDQQWGEQNHPDGTGDYQWAADLARNEADSAAKKGTLTWRHILQEEFWEALAETDPDKLRNELIQVAAVAVAWVEAIDRR